MTTTGGSPSDGRVVDRQVDGLGAVLLQEGERVVVLAEVERPTLRRGTGQRSRGRGQREATLRRVDHRERRGEVRADTLASERGGDLPG